MLTRAPKGTKDILPDSSSEWIFLEKKFRDICELYGFSEIRTPMFEHTELFKRGVGDSTDIVQKEMYTFLDYGKRSITLKPEGTSPVARAFMEHKKYADPQPTKYFYISPCFRYEKPQSGRLREFHQFGVEVFGTSSMMADAEVIILAQNFLDSLGIKDTELRINSVGCPKCREKHRNALKEFLYSKKDQLCDMCKIRYDINPMRILDCKDKSCQELTKDAPVMLDFLCEDCQKAFEDLRKQLDHTGIRYVVDPKIVRGLDYYTKTAFEFVTTGIGAQGTVCGGGRYDHLLEEIGDLEVPGVGFGLGIERLIMLMKDRKIDFPEQRHPKVCIAFIGDEPRLFAIDLVNRLRNNGISACIDLLERNIKGQFKFADRVNAEYVAVIGDDEIKSHTITVKNMRTGEQTKTAIEEMMELFR